MFHSLLTYDLTDLQDVLGGAAALAYILGFVVAVEVALGKLIY
jgi:hypothetical protein